MPVFKCKICGGALEIDYKQTVATCEYCGTRQTLPRLDDEKKANMYDRASHFRRNNDFDKAMLVYEQILNEDNTDAESYWSLLLCRYGIEYVEDPANKKRVPTVNRAQFTSIFDDEDYKSAINFADENQRLIYESEAHEINKIQKGILAISQKEDPFDVFICYKETDSSGRRTRDSVLATELYQELTKEGFKVFFSRITLEDKLGIAYEPYIFAALNSAKVMVVLGTKSEYFTAVWVKNEWSRYLALIKNGAKKTLIPAYRDMDPYDLPEEFSHLQALDMSKLGFMQDLVRGIKKIAKASYPKQAVKETVVLEQVNVNITPLLKRAFIFLEDGEFESADEYAERVLDEDPENAQAYLVKLMIDLQVRKKEQLLEQSKPFDDNKYYQKAIRYSKPEFAAELNGYIEATIVRIEEIKRIEEENARLQVEKLKEEKYLFGVEKINNPNSTEQDFYLAVSIFKILGDYKDSIELLELAKQKAHDIECEEKYAEAVKASRSNRIYLQEKAISAFSQIRGYKDSEYQIEQCMANIKKLEEIEKREIKIALIVIFGIMGIAILMGVISTIIGSRQREERYYEAKELMRNAQYEEAIEIFEELGNYENSKSELEKCQGALYDIAVMQKDGGLYLEAIKKFYLLGDYYKDSKSLAAKTRQLANEEAAELASLGQYYKAYKLLEPMVEYSKESDFPMMEAYKLMVEGNYKGAVNKGLTDLIIPEGVTNIGDEAFYNCNNLKTISLPSTVTSIGNNAFCGCESLTNIKIPSSVTKIGNDAFYGCSSLTNVTVPDSVIEFGDSVFMKCTSLTEIYLGTGVKNTGKYTFYGCTKLTNFKCYAEVIGEGAFENCDSISSITLSASKTIGDEAFYSCDSLTRFAPYPQSF